MWPRPSLTATARSMAFSSWRTLPGQWYAIRRRIASCDTDSGGAVVAGAELVEEVLDQQRNVLSPFAQRPAARLE